MWDHINLKDMSFYRSVCTADYNPKTGLYASMEQIKPGKIGIPLWT